MQKVCENCQKTFSTNKLSQRFCSADCRTKWHNHHDPERSYAAYMERKKKAAIKHRLKDLAEEIAKTNSDIEALSKAIQAENLQKKAEYEKRVIPEQEQEKQEQIISNLLALCESPAINVFSYLTKELGPILVDTIAKENNLKFKAEEYIRVLRDIRENLMHIVYKQLSKAKYANGIKPSTLDFDVVITPVDNIKTENEIRCEVWYHDYEAKKKSKWGFSVTLAGYGYYSSDGYLVGPFFYPMHIYWKFEDNPQYELRYDSHGQVISA